MASLNSLLHVLHAAPRHRPTFERLPRALLRHVLLFCTEQFILSTAALVSREWNYVVVSSKELWRAFDFSSIERPHGSRQQQRECTTVTTATSTSPQSFSTSTSPRRSHHQAVHEEESKAATTPFGGVDKGRMSQRLYAPTTTAEEEAELFMSMYSPLLMAPSAAPSASASTSEVAMLGLPDLFPHQRSGHTSGSAAAAALAGVAAVKDSLVVGFVSGDRKLLVLQPPRALSVAEVVERGKEIEEQQQLQQQQQEQQRQQQQDQRDSKTGNGGNEAATCDGVWIGGVNYGNITVDTAIALSSATRSGPAAAATSSSTSFASACCFPRSLLRSICLDNCASITNASLFAIAFHCPVLECFSAAGCNAIDDLGVAALLQCCPRLSCLNLSRTNITDATTKAILGISSSPSSHNIDDRNSESGCNIHSSSGNEVSIQTRDGNGVNNCDQPQETQRRREGSFVDTVRGPRLRQLDVSQCTSLHISSLLVRLVADQQSPCRDSLEMLNASGLDGCCFDRADLQRIARVCSQRSSCDGEHDGDEGGGDGESEAARRRFLYREEGKQCASSCSAATTASAAGAGAPAASNSSSHSPSFAAHAELEKDTNINNNLQQWRWGIGDDIGTEGLHARNSASSRSNGHHKGGCGSGSGSGGAESNASLSSTSAREARGSSRSSPSTTASSSGAQQRHRLRQPLCVNLAPSITAFSLPMPFSVGSDRGRGSRSSFPAAGAIDLHCDICNTLLYQNLDVYVIDAPLWEHEHQAAIRTMQPPIGSNVATSMCLPPRLAGESARSSKWEKKMYNCKNNCHTVRWLIDEGGGYVDDKGFRFLIAVGKGFARVQPTATAINSPQQ